MMPNDFNESDMLIEIVDNHIDRMSFKELKELAREAYQLRLSANSPETIRRMYSDMIGNPVT